MPTSTATIWETPRVHVRMTRANTPVVIPPVVLCPVATNKGGLPPTSEGAQPTSSEGGTPVAATKGGVPGVASTVARPTRKTRRAHGVIIGFNSNNIKHAKRKPVTALVDEQLTKDKEVSVEATPMPAPRRSLRLNPTVTPAPNQPTTAQPEEPTLIDCYVGRQKRAPP